jgi:phage shock protein C
MGKNKTLKLDKLRKKLLGVCAGLAAYLDVEPWTVRAVFLGCVIFGGWFLVPLYFVAWFLLDDASSGARAALSDNLAVKHFRTVDYKKKLYRNTRDGKWLGVCAGIADYLEMSVFVVRMVFLLLFFTTGGIPLIFYLAAWMVLDPQPGSLALGQDRNSSSKEAELADRWSSRASGNEKTEKGKDRHRLDEMQDDATTKRKEFRYCARKFASLQTRLVRMEAYVTSSRFKLHREFREM